MSFIAYLSIRNANRHLFGVLDITKNPKVYPVTPKQTFGFRNIYFIDSDEVINT
ncbi:hypothetical protein JOD18_000816 [Gracilibacillus alcaliphilus]|nr:hypothetical protein [Gracilibacillus alcaliphilus]